MQINYKKIYDDLVAKAQSRILEKDEYYERHHILPRCLGGTDDGFNITELTPEEHYVAHQLLVKIHPQERKLVLAAAMMRANRPTNKLYGWIKRRHAIVMKEIQSGEGNSQFGTRWVHSVELKKSKKLPKDEELPDGWSEGRKMKFDSLKPQRNCRTCGNTFSPERNVMYCSHECKYGISLRSKTNIDTNLDAILAHYSEHKSVRAVLTEFGALLGSGHQYLTAILKEHGFEIKKRGITGNQKQNRVTLDHN